jgi:ATP-binding cassette subfamily C (CFTR/MRP) protein 1
MDQIIVLKDGKISEVGTYEQLISSRGAFADFLIEQLQKEEENMNDEDKEATSMSESEMESLKHQLEETLGKRDMHIKMKRAQKKQKNNKKVKTTSIGSLSEGDLSYIKPVADDTDSILSEASARIRKRKYSRQTSFQDQVVSIPEDGILSTKSRRYQTPSDDTEENKSQEPSIENKKTYKAGKDLIEEEGAKVTSVALDSYLYYARSAGFLFSFFGAFFYACFQVFTVSSNLWLSVWSSDVEAATNESKRNMYLTVYGGKFRKNIVMNYIMKLKFLLNSSN